MWQFLAQADAGGEGLREKIDALARTPISIIVYIAAVATAIRLILFFATRDVPAHKRTAGFGVARFANEALDAIVYALVFVFLLIRPFGIQAFTIPTGSMVPALMINDFIIANKAVYRYSEPQFQDVVVFKPPQRGLFENQRGKDVDYIKRLIGTPGDTIEIVDNTLIRNGKRVNEEYAKFLVPSARNEFVAIPKADANRIDFKLIEHEGRVIPVVYDENAVNSADWQVPAEFRPDSPEEAHQMREAPPAKIPPGKFLMVGDNRLNSFDGRFWGLIDRDSVIGRAEFIWLPFNRIGSVD